MDPAEFRKHGYALVDWIAEYLDSSERFPVLAQVAPGDVVRALPAAAPEAGEPFESIFADFERVLVPALTHWNHPGFFAYFAITASAPGVLAEFLTAALNQQAMLWRTSPAATELEEVSLGWLRRLLGLPDEFEGVIYDTASISTLHALAAAREAVAPGVRTNGLASAPSLAVYGSEHAHSALDKAAALLGLGLSAVRHVPSDNEFRMDVRELRRLLDADRRAGIIPMAVVPTIGTTATTSVDPVRDVIEVCREQNVWVHVDAAYAGVAAMIPECRAHFTGWEQADSIVLNPHKWLFVPFDLSAFYCRRMDVVRATFSVVPDFLTTKEHAHNLMDTGIQLGRRFRALKLWMVLRHYGADGIRRLLEGHLRLARLFASWVDASTMFERVAPVPFSVVCFRACPDGLTESDLDRFNAAIVDRVNGSGEAFLSHTRLNGRLTIRLAVGHARTTEEHVARAWTLLQSAAAELAVPH